MSNTNEPFGISAENQPDVIVATAELSCARCELQEAVDALWARLEPVLGETPQSLVPEEAARPANCPLSRAIYEEVNSICGSVSSVKNLLSRLEV